MLLIAARQLEMDAHFSPCLGGTPLRLQTLPSLDERSADLHIFYLISPDDAEVWLMWIEPKRMGAESDQRLREELDGAPFGPSGSPSGGRSH